MSNLPRIIPPRKPLTFSNKYRVHAPPPSTVSPLCVGFHDHSVGGNHPRAMDSDEISTTAHNGPGSLSLITPENHHPHHFTHLPRGGLPLPETFHDTLRPPLQLSEYDLMSSIAHAGTIERKTSLEFFAKVKILLLHLYFR
jgi:hypothetical protein